MSESIGNTQPIRPLKPRRRFISVLISILGLILLIALGAFGGYRMALGDRQSAEQSIVTQQLAEQYQYALVDIQFGRFEAARQRLEFIIFHDPSFPGVQQQLTLVLVKSTVPTQTPLPTLTPTPDSSGAESAYQRARQLVSGQDWPNAIEAIGQVRKLAPTYKTAEVDGMFYFALRNYGYDLITKQGNLEGGIYELTLAERFGPLDKSANGLRDGAREYITGASFWEIDWRQAVAYFSQVGAGWPSLWDGTMTASQRYYYALMRYGDHLYQTQEFCTAVKQYELAKTMGALDAAATKGYNQSYQACFPPTEVPQEPPVEPSATP